MSDSSHIIKMTAEASAASSLVSALVGWVPFILAIPASVYYAILIIEKITGKSIVDIFRQLRKRR